MSILLVVAICHAIPILFTILLAIDNKCEYDKYKYGKLIYFSIYVISAFVNGIVYFAIHKIITGRWNFLKTALRVYRYDLTYQELFYFPASFFICSACAIILGLFIRFILNSFIYKNHFSKCVPQKRSILLYGVFSIECLVSIVFLGIWSRGIFNLVFNEVNANSGIVIDGEVYEDYIEIYNKGLFANEITDLYLSDDEDKLNKYACQYLYIKSNECVLIEVDDANLPLSKKGGQTLYLSDASGRIIDSIKIKEAKDEYVMCRVEDGAEEWVVSSPSPGLPNSERRSKIKKPEVSCKSGFYDDSFELELVAEEGCNIYYTTDCSVPTEESKVYDAPIFIYDRSKEPNVFRDINNNIRNYDVNKQPIEPVDKAFVLRAFTMDAYGNRSDSITETYFVGKSDLNDDVIISLIADPEELYGDNGIYVTGNEYDDWYLNGQEGDEPEANFNKRGIEYEIPAYLEVFSKEFDFSQNIGLRVSGGNTRNNDFKSFSFFARKKYSGSSTFEGQPFDVLSHKLGTRGGYANSIIQKLSQNRNVATQGIIRARLYVNGEFYCNTNLIEKYDERYFQQHYGIDGVNCVIICNGQYAREEDEGYLDEVYNFMDENDLSDQGAYEQFCSMVDIQSYIDYMCIRTYVDDLDFTEVKNSVMWKSKVESANPYEDGKWRYALYDLDAMENGDAILWGYNEQAEKNSFSIVPRYTDGITINNQTMFVHLKKNELFRKQYVNTFMDLVNSTFRYDNVVSCIKDYGENKDSYQTSTQDLQYYYDFFRDRPQYIIPYMAEEMGLKGTVQQLQLMTDTPEGGRVRVNSIEPNWKESCWQGEYYTDYPINLVAIPNEGYMFKGWMVGDEIITEDSTEIYLKEGGCSINAIFEKK